METKKGIDVSRHQGKINWEKVDASGIDFVLIRAGFGNDEKTQTDNKWLENVTGALSKGLNIGAYWFSYATSVADAVAEAQAFKRVITPYSGKLTMPVAFDYEYDSMDYFKRQKGYAPSSELINDMASAFMNEMKKGCWFTNLYTNIDFIKTGRFSSELRNAFDVWLADYSGAPDYPCGIQQTTSRGSVPGITGLVDMDEAFKDYPTLIAAKGMNGLKPHTSPASKTNSMGQYGPKPTLKFSGRKRQTIAYLQQHVGVTATGIADLATYNACRLKRIQIGDRSTLVLWVQQYLNGLGFNCGVADGYAEAATMAGIARFQKTHGLGVGYLGGTDWYYILEL